MRFVADESCSGPVVRALRTAGHDVLWIAESSPGSPDDSVISFALREDRVLITEDTDFGELVFARRHSSAGILLLRYSAKARRAMPSAVVMAVSKLGSRLKRGFAVVEPGRVRLAKRPK